MGRRTADKVGVWAHRCTSCGQRYESTEGVVAVGKRGAARRVPAPDGECSECRTGHAPPIWILARRPKDCCRAESRPMTRADERERYRLAGSASWWICTTCSRTHPFNPENKEME